MSDSNWISARQAQRQAKNAGFTGNDLIEWAREGLLRARAKKGILSSDLFAETENTLDCVRTFPAAPPADKLARDTLGCWPDVPADFWAEKPTKAVWGAGTFASGVSYWCGYNQARMCEHIELFGVTFHADDLEALLTWPVPATGAQAERGVLPSNATPGQRRYEEAAHLAANIVRSTKCYPSEAFRQALEETKAVASGTWDTRQRKLREVYNSMYNPQGWPIPKDPD